MFSRHHKKAKLLFALSDVALTCLAFEAAYLTRLLLPLDNDFFLSTRMHVSLLLVAAIVWVAVGYWLSIYDRLESAKAPELLADTVRQTAVGSVCVILLEYVLRLDLSRAFLVIFASYSTVLLALVRFNARRIAGKLHSLSPPSYLLVVGTGDRAIRLARLLDELHPYGVRLVGFLADVEEPRTKISLGRTYPVYPMDDLRDLLERQVIDEVLFAVESHRLAELEEVFLYCDEEGVRTRLAVDFFPHVNSEISLDRLGTAPLLTFTAAPDDELRLFVKRVTDIAIASTALAISAPFVAVLAVLIRLTSPGPAIFRQVRCGLNGRRFVFYKFRSMCVEAEALKPALAHLNVKQTAFKIPDDPRLTPIGRYMRKFSIDEWPQLWNVLRGDMSIVGPRPAVPEEVERYQTWQRRRLRMRPGLTCLWAISGRDHLDFDTWMRMDLQYIDQWSLALDWKIILRTIPQVLLGKGAH